MLNNISNRNHHLTAPALAARGEEDNGNGGRKIKTNRKEESADQRFMGLFHHLQRWPETLNYSKPLSLIGDLDFPDYTNLYHLVLFNLLDISEM